MLLVILKKLIALSVSKKNASQSVQHSERTANFNKIFPSRAFMLDILFYILHKSEYSRQAHDGTNSSWHLHHHAVTDSLQLSWTVRNVPHPPDKKMYQQSTC